MRYSLLFNNKIILGIIFYNVFVRSGNLVKDKSVLLYNIIVNNVDLCITSDLVKNCKSLESLFNSMSWLEREVSEFIGFSFFSKRDNRSLFLWSTLGGLPLSKTFPLVGYWSIVLDNTSSISWARQSVVLNDVYYGFSEKR